VIVWRTVYPLTATLGSPTSQIITVAQRAAIDQRLPQSKADHARGRTLSGAPEPERVLAHTGVARTKRGEGIGGFDSLGHASSRMTPCPSALATSPSKVSRPRRYWVISQVESFRGTAGDHSAVRPRSGRYAKSQVNTPTRNVLTILPAVLLISLFSINKVVFFTYPKAVSVLRKCTFRTFRATLGVRASP
jgi:hypothetical protein